MKPEQYTIEITNPYSANGVRKSFKESFEMTAEEFLMLCGLVLLYRDDPDRMCLNEEPV